MARKVNRNEFLCRIARKADMPLEDVREVYNTFCDEMQSVLCGGCDLSLTGLGTFAMRKHKGHPVQFDAKDGSIKDYMVLKFVPSGVLVTKIREGLECGKG